MSDIGSLTSYTLLVGSVSPERKIPWTKPEDVLVDEQFSALGTERGFGAPYKTVKGSGGVFAFLDMVAKAMRDDIELPALRKMVQCEEDHIIDDIPELQPCAEERELFLTVPLGTPGATAKFTLGADCWNPFAH